MISLIIGGWTKGCATLAPAGNWKVAPTQAIAAKGSRLPKTQIPGKNCHVLAAPVHAKAFFSLAESALE